MACAQILIHRWGPRTRILALVASLTDLGRQLEMHKQVSLLQRLKLQIPQTVKRAESSISEK